MERAAFARGEAALFAEHRSTIFYFLPNVIMGKMKELYTSLQELQLDPASLEFEELVYIAERANMPLTVGKREGDRER